MSSGIFIPTFTILSGFTGQPTEKSGTWVDDLDGIYTVRAFFKGVPVAVLSGVHSFATLVPFSGGISPGAECWGGSCDFQFYNLGLNLVGSTSTIVTPLGLVANDGLMRVSLSSVLNLSASADITLSYQFATYPHSD